MRDITLGETIDLKFTTTAASTGAPTQLAGTPVISAYVGNSTTQITAGITLTVDFDTVTGLNNVRVVATSGNGYTDNTDVYLVITTGTVGGTSAVGYVVGGFTIGRAAAYTRLGAPAGASIAADLVTIDNFVDDIESRLGTPSNLGGGATIAANLSDIEAQTDDIGVAGAGLTAVPWNAAWDAEVQSEVEDGLVVHRLDELLNADSDIDGVAPPTVGSVFHELMTKTAGSFTYDQTTDSLEAVRDRGDAAWITATGFSTHSAADVWAVATRVLTAGTNINGSTFTAIPWNAAWDAEVQSEVQDALDAAVSEPAQGAPAANASISTSIKLLYKAWRNKSTQTSTQYSLYNDDAATIDHKATVSDDGTTLTRGEVATGP